jgi:hypothetical protein
MHTGFAVVHHKTGQVTWLSHKTKTGGSAGRDGIRARREASKRRTHVRIARLASRQCEGRSSDIRPMLLQRHIPKVPLVGVCPSLGFRGVLVFRLSPYILRGERMAAICRNPSSFRFPICNHLGPFAPLVRVCFGVEWKETPQFEFVDDKWMNITRL